MKRLFRPYLAFLLMGSLTVLTAACGGDDPEPVEEQELITSMTIEFTPQGKPNSPITSTYSDLDGDGGQVPSASDILPLAPNVTYDVKITLADASKNPPVDITEEVNAEGVDHELFYEDVTNTLGLEITRNRDIKGNALGLTATIKTPAAANTAGNLRVTLKHQPGIKSNISDPTKGDTDFVGIFPVVIN